MRDLFSILGIKLKWIVMVDCNEERWKVGSLKIEEHERSKLGSKRKLMINSITHQYRLVIDMWFSWIHEWEVKGSNIPKVTFFKNSLFNFGSQIWTWALEKMDKF